MKKELLTGDILFKDPSYKKKILLIDIENLAHLGWVWEIYDTNVIEIERPGHLLSMAYKWLGDKKTHCIALSDFKGYKPLSDDDSKLCKEIWDLFNEAEVIIGHNAQGFDIKKINYRLMIHGFTPTAPYKVVDTYLALKRVAKAPSNKLDALGKDFKIGRKVEHEGWSLWKKCYLGDMKAWKKMKDYNIQDVILLEKWYYKLRPWIGNHPNMNLILGGQLNCRVCHSQWVNREGTRKRLGGLVQDYSCKNCGAWGHVPITKKDSIMR